MDTIYVTGHRNPDTDSIVASMAYTALQNACGNWEYQAAALGHVSDETQIVLDRFGFDPPQIISNLYTQVRDLDFDKPPILSAAVTEGRAWSVLKEDRNIVALPVANDDGTLCGMLSREDIAAAGHFHGVAGNVLTAQHAAEGAVVVGHRQGHNVPVLF